MEVLDTRYGKLIASRNDVYIGRGLFEYGEFSENEVEFFRQVIDKESVVCDVGANIGAHTLAFSRLAKHVYAFEPVPTLFNALAGMVAINDLRNVDVYQVGIGATDTVMAYQNLDFDHLNNLGASTLSKFEGERGVRVMPLNIPCNFLKVDVEGMELEVLQGAEKMIRQCKPLLYLEADRKEKFAALSEFIKELGYHAYWHLPPLYNPHNRLGKPKDIFDGVCSLNLCCFPYEVEGGVPAVHWDFPPTHRYEAA
jgi:FkbM family methyltransferase